MFSAPGARTKCSVLISKLTKIFPTSPKKKNKKKEQLEFIVFFFPCRFLIVLDQIALSHFCGVNMLYRGSFFITFCTVWRKRDHLFFFCLKILILICVALIFLLPLPYFKSCMKYNHLTCTPFHSQSSSCTGTCALLHLLSGSCDHQFFACIGIKCQDLFGYCCLHYFNFNEIDKQALKGT